MAGSGPPSGGIWIKPNQYSGRSAATESSHQPDRGIRKINRYSSAWPARAPSACQRGMPIGSSGRESNTRQLRRNTASASTVRPTDLWNVYHGITPGPRGRLTMVQPTTAWQRISSTIVQ